jgi:hypothetical protein
MKFATEQQVFIAGTFARKKRRKCIRKFRCEYPDSPVPTKSCVSKLVKKWQATGSVWHKEEVEEDCVDWRKGLGYWGTTTDQSSKIIKTLSTGNQRFTRICFLGQLSNYQLLGNVGFHVGVYSCCDLWCHSLIDRYRHFKGTYWLQLHPWRWRQYVPLKQ